MNIRFSDQELYLDTNSIFLAGPTMRNSTFSKSWRKKACMILEELKFDGTVYVPEYYSDKEFEDDAYINQTKWEWECLDIADVIVFWVPRQMKDMPALTTNIEFGRYLTKKKDSVILGYPRYAEKMKYMDLLYRTETGRIPETTLGGTLRKALLQLDYLN